MLIFHPCSSSLCPQSTLSYQFSRHCTYFPSVPIVSVPKQNFYARTGASLFGAKQNRAQRRTTQNVQGEIADDYYDDDGGDGENEFSSRSRFRGREEEEKDYDRDPEFAEIIGSCLDDPQKAQSKMEERLRRKRNKVLHTKTGSSTPIKLSQSTFDKRPNYDAIQGANVTPTTFYNIGDFEIQDNLARIWVDIGTTEPLLLDVLINALTQISSDYVGIKQLVFGGSEFENWKENLTSEDAGYSVHKI